MQTLTATGLALRVGIFALVGILTLQLVSFALGVTGLLVQAAMAVFASAAVANALALRIYERAGFARIGLAWKQSSRRNLGIGLMAGIGSGLAVTVLPALVGAAHFVRDAEHPLALPSLLFVSVVLLFGAVGEEMLFHGYAFQLLMARVGAFATLLPVGVLFAAAHSNNLASNALSSFNTFLWGVLLGLCFLRSGDLWLPIGLHFGWNWVLPIVGVPVSGFRMGTSGLALVWNIGPIWSGGDYGPEAGLLTTALVPILGYVLWKAPVETERPPLFPEEEPTV